ncbi:MAG TPA: hypothetical protein DEV93_07880 [Chloroflexi bacterium]|nr:hypothetical protein [Chloroflexota bacterium]
MTFQLRFPSSQVSHWAGQYPNRYNDAPIIRIGAEAQARGSLTRDEFLAITEWKTKRSKSRCRKNSESFVREVTSCALTSTEPRLKIEVLRLLDGVEWATASVILHFCDEQRWPILDFRAFWSLQMPAPTVCDFALWEAYVEHTRRLADELAVDMRTLDKALWSYSEANQPPS